MSKQFKKFYRFLAWFFSIIIASGSLSGCSTKYGPPPTTKYGVRPDISYESNLNNKDSKGPKALATTPKDRDNIKIVCDTNNP